MFQTAFIAKAFCKQAVNGIEQRIELESYWLISENCQVLGQWRSSPSTRMIEKASIRR
jgi:hypothetical protein